MGLVGIDSKYYENGIVEYIQNYDNDTIIIFYKNGSIKSKKQNNNGDILIENFYENGKILSIEKIIESKKMYITEKYDINGLLIHYTKIIKGHTIINYELFN